MWVTVIRKRLLKKISLDPSVWKCRKISPFLCGISNKGSTLTYSEHKIGHIICISVPFKYNGYMYFQFTLLFYPTSECIWFSLFVWTFNHGNKILLNKKDNSAATMSFGGCSSWIFMMMMNVSCDECPDGIVLSFPGFHHET